MFGLLYNVQIHAVRGTGNIWQSFILVVKSGSPFVISSSAQAIQSIESSYAILYYSDIHFKISFKSRTLHLEPLDKIIKSLKKEK